MYSDEDLLALSGLQHIAFCERQWALIHIEQVWEDNAETMRGEFFHERVDTKGYSCSAGVKAERRVRLTEHALGVYGVADIVEYDMSGDPIVICPVEYKVGEPKKSDWDKIQLAAQAMCLEEMTSKRVTEGALFYGKTRRRERVQIDESLRERVVKLASRMHCLFSSGEIPLAALMPRCRRCSLHDLCLPEASRMRASEYWAQIEKSLVKS